MNQAKKSTTRLFGKGQARLESWVSVAVIILAVASLGSSCWASTETVLYRFGVTITGDGKGVPAGLVADSSGNFYGVTQYGGNNGNGTVFELSPGTGGTWNETILHSFGSGTDGSQPVGGLILDSSGNLYGTTTLGCSSNNGTVFELSRSGGSWTETVLYSFAGGSDGSFPLSSLNMHTSSTLYGTTALGGNSNDCAGNGCGTVYKLTLSGGSWTETVLHAFNGGDGSYIAGAVVFDSSSNLYGTAGQGTSYHFGTVYKLDTSGTLTTLYTFTGGSDGGGPFGNLVWDLSGNLYGTTEYGGVAGGSSGHGTVFELSFSGGTWTESVLYSFATSAAGYPVAGLVFDSSGNLYGTTTGNGSAGIVFKLAPGLGSWTETTLHTFGANLSDGKDAESTLIFDSSGNLYGTTFLGGATTTCMVSGPGSGCGVVFKVTP